MVLIGSNPYRSGGGHGLMVPTGLAFQAPESVSKMKLTMECHIRYLKLVSLVCFKVKPVMSQIMLADRLYWASNAADSG